MKTNRPIIDRILLNRLVAMITSFILGVLKIISTKTKVDDPDVVPKPPKPPKFPWLRKQVDKLKSTDNE
jgi:hypothetical protein